MGNSFLSSCLDLFPWRAARGLKLQGITVHGMGDLELTSALLHGFCQRRLVEMKNAEESYVCSISILQEQSILCGKEIQLVVVMISLQTKSNITFVFRCSLFPLIILHSEV